MTDQVENIIKNIIHKFNTEIGRNTKLKKEMKGKRRIIDIKIKDHTIHNHRVYLHNNMMEMAPPGWRGLDKPDIYICTDKDTLIKMHQRKLKAMNAYFSKKIELDASLKDMGIMLSLFKSRK